MPSPFPLHPRAYFWIFALLAAILTLTPIRSGDLPGYDDASFAHMAKGIVNTGDWLNLHSNGGPALEHPPLFHWMEAAMFSIMGVSDFAAKLPAAICGFLTILLVYWLGRRLLADSFGGALAMFVMANSIYFLKYSARAMTDVPFTFFFLCSLCAWMLAEDDPRWFIVAALAGACAQLTRGLMGFSLPVIFVVYAYVSGKRPPRRYAVALLVLMFLPLAAWYGYTVYHNRAIFFGVHNTWLRNEVYGPLTPAWRRYTGAPEYLWMITKSYWPWLPFMIAGMVVVIQRRDRRLSLLLVWIGVVFLLCAITRSRVLRYMLPAYPAFAILAAIGLRRLIPELYLRRGLNILTPAAAVVVLAVAIFPPTIRHSSEIRPIARAAELATPADTRVAFYDEGNPRYDETNQLLWYGNRNLIMLFSHEQLVEELRTPHTQVFIVDKPAYRAEVAGHEPNQIITESGNLVLFRLITNSSGASAP